MVTSRRPPQGVEHGNTRIVLDGTLCGRGGYLSNHLSRVDSQVDMGSGEDLRSVGLPVVYTFGLFRWQSPLGGQRTLGHANLSWRTLLAFTSWLHPRVSCHGPLSHIHLGTHVLCIRNPDQQRCIGDRITPLRFRACSKPVAVTVHPADCSKPTKSQKITTVMAACVRVPAWFRLVWCFFNCFFAEYVPVMRTSGTGTESRWHEASDASKRSSAPHSRPHSLRLSACV